MPTAHRHPPNRQLSWERLQRGWSYEELAERIRVSMERAGETFTGLTANTVRRWETGERWPEPRYRKHLVAIFNKPASELGLLTPEELAMRPVSDVVREIRRLLSMIGDEGIDRGTFLRALLGVGLFGPLLTEGPDSPAWKRLESVLDGRGNLDADSVDAYADVVTRQSALYWSTPAAELFEASAAHTQLGVRLLRTSSSTDLRERLAGAAARSALLTGRIAFFDLQQPVTAQRLFQTAILATRECGDHALAAAVLAHAAFVPGFARDEAAAQGLIEAAFAHAWHGVGPLTRAWLHCVASEIRARCGDAKGCLRHIDRADRAIDGTGDDPAWLDFFGRARLDGFAGYSALAAGETAEAARRLDRALGALGDGEGKQRSVLLADLAAAHAGSDADLAIARLDEAVEALTGAWYATGYERIDRVQRALPDGREMQTVRERLHALDRLHRPELSA
ncbi:helix-turn-helix transcriptional regulator [Planomonospora sp. ID82291]|uniref:helix-turn-helix domain-containing protein n=1 Tax=Planomonospora sp. ID82291 TaxID=2738136 RepID=UPI0018C4149B|nr:helix-turn-helix transcriptional regulator [Planomonospora sp. ID82291]MBG0818673.1 helix-turn-helix transcriptional regulator [Planomonospora sp. ID82291]